VNRSEQRKTRKLFEPSRFLKLKTGHCILINPGYSNAQEAAVPIQQEIRLPQAELNAVKHSTKQWEDYQQRLIEKRQQRQGPSDQDIKERRAVAEEYFKEKKQTAVGARKLPFKLNKLPQFV
jgi:type IV secretory pathway TraG/TraD family ATPase VirD4